MFLPCKGSKIVGSLDTVQPFFCGMLNALLVNAETCLPFALNKQSCFETLKQNISHNFFNCDFQ